MATTATPSKLRSRPRGNARIANVYQSKDGKWRWTLLSAGRCVADSGQGYTRRSDARNALHRLLAATSDVEVREYQPGAFHDPFAVPATSTFRPR